MSTCAGHYDAGRATTPRVFEQSTAAVINADRALPATSTDAPLLDSWAGAADASRWGGLRVLVSSIIGPQRRPITGPMRPQYRSSPPTALNDVIGSVSASPDVPVRSMCAGLDDEGLERHFHLRPNPRNFDLLGLAGSGSPRTSLGRACEFSDITCGFHGSLLLMQTGRHESALLTISTMMLELHTRLTDAVGA